MIPWEVWSRVFRFAGESGHMASAFLIDVDHGRFLVTARHVTSGESKEHVVLRHPWTRGGTPTSHVLERVGGLSAPGDVAAFIAPEDLAARTGPVMTASRGLVLTQECFLLGYPSGLQPDGQEQNKQLPIVKRAILSGSSTGTDGSRTFLVDTIANPGFAGGPLVFRNESTGRFHFGGVISDTLSAPLLDAPEDAVSNPRVPSGLAAVADIDSVLALVP